MRINIPPPPDHVNENRVHRLLKCGSFSIMPAIYLQEPLSQEERSAISIEFPHYDIFESCDEERLSQVEVFYGSQLGEKEFKSAPRLRWVHTPAADFSNICLEAIKKRGGCVVSITKGENVAQIAEYVIGGILGFAKQFFHWKEVTHDPSEFWQWPLKETIWTLNKKTLLQVGLGPVGSAIVQRSNAFGMQTWGVLRDRSFHPHCHKTFSLNELHSILPHADVVSVALPQIRKQKEIFQKTEFTLMKNDSIFVLVGSATAIDEEALAAVAKRGKFRGVLLDTFQRPPPAKHSPLWEIPNGILTPSIASFPEDESHFAFRLFRLNLRLFAPGRTNEMKNLILRP